MTVTPSGVDIKAKGVPLIGRMQLVMHGLAFVAGFTMIFVLLGAVISVLFSGAAPTLKEIIGRVGGVLIIVFGLHSMGLIPWLFKRLRQNTALLNTPILTMIVVAGLFALVLWAFGTTLVAGLLLAASVLGLLMVGAFTQPGVFWRQALDQFDAWFYADTRPEMSSAQSGSLVGSFTLGVIFAAGWTPCIGPMLGGILGIAARGDHLLDGIVLLTAYSLGLGMPFLATAVLLQPMQSFLRRIQRSMRVIKLVSGALMVLIGVLVTRGDLASLSQGLGSRFADFSYLLEECGTGVFGGTLNVGQFGGCMDSLIVPVALNQGAGATLSDQTPQMTYLITLAAPLAVDVELNRVSDPQQIVVTVKNAADEILAKSSTLIRLDDKRYTAVANLALPAGQFQIIVTRPQGISAEVDFRVKLRIMQPLPEQPVTLPHESTDSTNADSPLLDLASQGAAALVTPEPTSFIPPVNEGIQGASTLNTITDAAAASGPSVGTEIGQRAPDFSIMLDTGETITLADLRGHVVLLNFWGTWCGPCRREMPDFEALYEQYGKDGFVVLALAQRDTASSVAQFRKDYGLTFLLALDEEQRVNTLYDVPGQPSSFLIDQNGVIVYHTYSVVDGDTVSGKILDLMEAEK